MPSTGGQKRDVPTSYIYREMGLQNNMGFFFGIRRSGKRGFRANRAYFSDDGSFGKLGCL